MQMLSTDREYGHSFLRAKHISQTLKVCAFLSELENLCIKWLINTDVK